MKKLFLILTTVILLTGCEKETIIQGNQVPQKIKTYLETHFIQYPVLQVLEDRDGFTLTYDVTLQQGYFLEFNRKMEIEEVTGSQPIPNSVVPSGILTYVQTHFSDHLILSWDLSDRIQEVTLDNGMQLEFDKEGNFLRIDN